MSDDLLIVGARVLVGSALEPTAGRSVHIRDGVIVSIDARHARSQTILDLAGCTLLPGLVDAHVHFDLAGLARPFDGWRAPPAIRGLVMFRNGLAALATGITAVRDLGSVDASVVRFADEVDRGRIVGPRIRACARPIARTGGHLAEYVRVADGVADVRQAVREQIRDGATVIKVMASGGFSSPGNPAHQELDDEELASVVAEAHRADLPVAAHAHGDVAIATAIKAGVDTIEHGALLGTSAARALADSRRPLVPTLAPLAARIVNPSPDATIRARHQEELARMQRAVRTAIGAGVVIAAGTDAGTGHNPIGELVSELERYVELGLPPAQAVAAATVVGGQLIGEGVGVIEVGAVADLIAVGGDPLEDVAALRDIRAVVRAGKPLDLAWLRATVERIATDGSQLVERSPR